MATYSAYLSNGTWGIIYLELAQVSQSIANNTSTVSYKFYTKSRSSSGGFYNYYHTGKTSVVINGKTVHNQTGRDFDVRGGKVQQLASGTTTVAHNEDGTKSFSFSASLWSSGGTGNISGNFTLSKIPRKSDFYVKNESGSAIQSFFAGDKLRIDINKKASSFTHTLSIKYLGKEETLISKTTSSTITYSTSNKIMENYMQNLRSTPIDFVLNTYDGSTRIGYVVKRLTLYVPSSAGPSINSVDVTEANQNKINIIGSSPFYQLLSDLKVSTSASGNYGASIKNISVSLGNYSKSGSNVTLDNVNLKGNQNIKVTVQDSRGYSASTTKAINLSPYNLPNISFFNAYRTETNTKYASARISLTSTVISNKNPLSVKVDVSEKDKNSWRNVYSATVGNGSFNSTISLGGGFDDYKAYDVLLTIKDKFKDHQAISNIPATSQSLVIGANKPVVGIGKVPEIDKGLEVDGLLKVNGGIKMSGDISSIFTNYREIISLTLKNGLTGYIGARKDPFGGVSVWGKVTITNTTPTKKYNDWAILPKGYRPSVYTPFSIHLLKVNVDSYVIPGMVINPTGEIEYRGIDNSVNRFRVDFDYEFNIYFKTEEAW